MSSDYKVIKHHIPFNEVYRDGTKLSKDCEVTFSKSFSAQCNVLESFVDETGVTIITKFEVQKVVPVDNISGSFKIDNNE